MKNLSNVEKEFLRHQTDKTLQKIAEEIGINKKVSLEYEILSHSHILSVWSNLVKFSVAIAESATPGEHMGTEISDDGRQIREYTFTTTVEQYLQAIKMGLTKLKNEMEEKNKNGIDR